jgi:hypothetical protein
MMRTTATVVLLAFFSFNALAKAHAALAADSSYFAGAVPAEVKMIDLSDSLFAMKASKAPVIIYRNADERRLASLQ